MRPESDFGKSVVLRRQSRRNDVATMLAGATVLGAASLQLFVPSWARAEVSPPGGFIERTEEGAEPAAAPESSKSGEGKKRDANASVNDTTPANDAKPTKGAARPLPSLDTEFTHQCDWLCYGHAYATFKVGRGLRFNNPYRLSTPLGSSAESLSLTAPYSDIAVAMLFGDPIGFQQGGIVSASFAMAGVPQQVLAPGYATLFRFGPRFQARGSLAFPILLQPEANIGMDASLGAAWMFLSGIGLVSDVVFSLYEGAATDQHAATLIPILSLQLGLTVDIEVLP